VLLASGPVSADRIKGRDGACDTYLVKPVDETELLEIVMRLMRTTDEHRSEPLATDTPPRAASH
jgi:DNA-binding response OmpR family regulator